MMSKIGNFLGYLCDLGACGAALCGVIIVSATLVPVFTLTFIAIHHPKLLIILVVGVIVSCCVCAYRKHLSLNKGKTK